MSNEQNADYGRLREVAELLAKALRANVPDPYPDGAAGLALAAWDELNDGPEVGPCPVCGWLVDTEECRVAPEHTDGLDRRED